MTKKDYAWVEPKSRLDLRDWLKKHHHQDESVWIVIFKKGARRQNLTAREVTQEALCYGWIDSRPGKIDDQRFKLLLSPRRSGSPWSALNKRLISELEQQGLIAAPGAAKIKAAQADGSWDQLNQSDRLMIPSDLKKALKLDKKAADFFETIAPSSKRAILEWLQSAKTAETRAKRVSETIRLAKIGIRANHYQDLKKLKSG